MLQWKLRGMFVSGVDDLGETELSFRKCHLNVCFAVQCVPLRNGPIFSKWWKTAFQLELAFMLFLLLFLYPCLYAVV